MSALVRGMPRAAVGASVLVAALLVTGCAPELSAGGGASGGGGSATTPAAATATPGPTGTATAAPGAKEAPRDPAECLVGTWLADNDYFLASIRQFGDEIREVTGSVVVEFGAEGALRTDYQDWRIRGVAEGVEVLLRRDGVDTGTYSATETAVTFADTSIGSMIVVGGEGFEMPVTPEPGSVANAAYTCDALTAEIRAPEGALVLHRR